MLAAAHRPCAECRRPDYNRLTEAWRSIHPHAQTGADAIAAQLHGERLAGRGRARRRGDGDLGPDRGPNWPSWHPLRQRATLVAR
jgi:hypothetical protein